MVVLLVDLAVDARVAGLTAWLCRRCWYRPASAEVDGGRDQRRRKVARDGGELSVVRIARHELRDRDGEAAWPATTNQTIPNREASSGHAASEGRSGFAFVSRANQPDIATTR